MAGACLDEGFLYEIDILVGLDGQGFLDVVERLGVEASLELYLLLVIEKTSLSTLLPTSDSYS